MIVIADTSPVNYLVRNRHRTKHLLLGLLHWQTYSYAWLRVSMARYSKIRSGLFCYEAHKRQAFPARVCSVIAHFG